MFVSIHHSIFKNNQRSSLCSVRVIIWSYYYWLGDTLFLRASVLRPGSEVNPVGQPAEPLER